MSVAPCCPYCRGCERSCPECAPKPSDEEVLDVLLQMLGGKPLPNRDRRAWA